MNQRIFFGVLSFIILGWIIAIGYASSQQLDQPVFLDHYIDEYQQDEIQMQFYYITNKRDRKAVNYIMLDDIPGYVDHYYDPMMEEIPYEQRFGHYEVRSIYATLDLRGLDSIDEKMVFDKMRVHFSDGQFETVDVGEIIIHPALYNEKNYLSQDVTAAGADWAGYILNAEEDFSIESLVPHIPVDESAHLKVQVLNPEESFHESRFFKVVEDGAQNSQGIGYEDVNYPIVLNEEDKLAVSFINEGNYKYVLKSWVRVEGKDTDGLDVSFPTYLSQIPQLEKEDVKTIIEQKREDQ
ncbi:hypothetical protein [Planococcus halotolerans]|uniref:Uncharacterized protein n=1 Tax=Planococcus halotolerans TaxID=2233542 RepID=A0A365KLS4_9BACL|nr:hypothetical protein [Planococcus halotolerans]QHJ71773.1 hypothetical protein DNR44_014525 [Planococcus halotolerans]RAZ74012.1 hypothetical protein DP120_15620 [Planococcus halotolerans]